MSQKRKKINFTIAQEKDIQKRMTTVRKRTIPAFADDIHVWHCCFFANYVLENYIDVDYKFPHTLWTQARDVSAFILPSSEVVDFRTTRKRV